MKFAQSCRRALPRHEVVGVLVHRVLRVVQAGGVRRGRVEALVVVMVVRRVDDVVLVHVLHRVVHAGVHRLVGRGGGPQPQARCRQARRRQARRGQAGRGQAPRRGEPRRRGLGHRAAVRAGRGGGHRRGVHVGRGHGPGNGKGVQRGYAHEPCVGVVGSAAAAASAYPWWWW